MAITDDSAVESDEQFKLVLSNPTPGATLGRRSTIEVFIHDNEPSIRLSTDNFYNVQENSGALPISIFRERGLNSEVTVEFSTRDGSAHSGKDYTGVSGKLVFKPGETFKEIRVPLINDAETELAESFQMVLFNPGGGAGLAYPSIANITFLDDDIPTATFNFESPTYTVNELDGSAYITVLRSEPAVGGAWVNVATGVGTASAGVDYQPIDTQVYFGQGQTRNTVQIPITEDALAEGDEAVILSLRAPGSERNGPVELGKQAAALLTIQNAGNAVEFSQPTYYFVETNRLAHIQVRRRGEMNLAFNIAYSTSDLTGVAGLDYTAQSGTLTFAVGQATNGFTIPLIDNFSVNGTRQVRLALSDATGGAVLTPRSTATLHIADDERPVVLDPSFDSVLAQDSGIAAMVVQPDGKVVLGGSLHIQGTDQWKILMRLNPDGSLDRTFKEGSSGESRFTSIGALTVDAVGRVIAGGSHSATPGLFGIFRLQEDGALDATYKNGLTAQQLGYLGGVSIVAEADGGLIVVGEHASTDPGTWSGVARLTADGTLDPTFNPGSGASFSYPWNPTLYMSVSAVAVQPDGKIIIGGKFTSYNGVPRGGIARLNADGSLDTSFNPGTGVRYVVPYDPNRIGWVNAVMVQADGRIVIGGSFNRVNGVERWLAARLNPDGSLDASFDLRLGGDQVSVLAPQPDGKFLLGGNFGGPSSSGVARFHADGLPDGTLIISSYAVTALQPLTGGDFLVAGGFTDISGIPRSHLARIFGDGTKRRSVEWAAQSYVVNENGTNAVLTLLRGGNSGEPISVTVSTADDSAVTGLDYLPLQQVVGFAAGEIVKEFKIQVLDDGLVESVESFAVTLSQPSSDVLLGSLSRTRVDILDNEVKAVVDLGFAPVLNGGVGDVFPLADGEYFINGRDVWSAFSQVDGIQTGPAARLRADGSLDVSFSVQTIFTMDEGNCCPQINSVVTQPDGKVLFGGYFTQVHGTRRPGLARLNPDDSLDLTFNPPEEIAGNAWLVALQPDGKILVVAQTTVLWRLNPDGSLDHSFNRGDADCNIQSLTSLADGRIMVGGCFGAYNGEPRPRLVRLNADGSVDTRFTPSEGDPVTGNAYDRLLTVLPDGKPILTGYTQNERGEGRAALVRLNLNGLLDTAFAAAATVNRFNITSISSAVARTEGGLVIAANSERRSDGTSGALILELAADGSADPERSPILLDVGFNKGGPSLKLFRSGLTSDPEKVILGGNFSRIEGWDQPYLALIDPTLTPQTTRLSLRLRELLASEDEPATVKMLRTGDTSGSVSVKVAATSTSPNVVDGFVPTSGTVTFAPLETEKTFTIPLTGNNSLDPERQIEVTLSEPTDGALLGRAKGFVTLIDDERPGSFDTGFDADLFAPQDWGIVGVGTVLSLPDGRLRIWGNFQTVHGEERNGFAQLNADGTLDTSFTSGPTPPNLTLPQPDGKTFGYSNNRFVRFNVDGSVDAAFNVAHDTTTQIWTPVVSQPDGKLIVRGSFTSLNGVPRPGLARLNADGSVDLGFNPGSGVRISNDQPGGVSAIALQIDERILVAGNFAIVGGERAVRQSPD